MSDPAAPVPIIVSALLGAVRKRSLLDPLSQRRLMVRLARDAVQDLPTLRRWLTEGDINPKVGKVLLGLLPSRDDRRVGPCHILAHLAEGGMGRVDLVDHDGQLRVLKTMHADRTSAAKALRRFRREAAITADLDHPNVVRCHGHGEDRGALWMSLEFVLGGDVQQLVANEDGLPEADALVILVHTARGLAHAHAKGLIHRDIKPANLFVADDGRILVADFGLARLAEDDSSMLTAPGGALGTPCYMSPEQIRCEEIDHRCDIYALGCVLHDCLTGKPPWSGTLQEVLSGHLAVDPPPLDRLRPGLSPGTLDLWSDLLRKIPGERPRDADIVVHRIEAILDELGLAPDARLTPRSIRCATQTFRRSRSTVATAKPGGDTALTEVDENEPVTGDPPTVHLERPDAVLVGDLAHALDTPRITLVGLGTITVLAAPPNAVVGRGKDADLVLAGDPARCSRRHVHVTLDDAGTPGLVDLGSANGTWLDGRWLAPGETHPLPLGGHRLVIGDLTCELHVAPQRHPPTPRLLNAPQGRERRLGLEDHSHCDAIACGTPEGPWLILVARRCFLGAGEVDRPLPGWNGSPLEIGRYRGVWLWRQAPAPWQPLVAGELTGTGLVVEPG